MRRIVLVLLAAQLSLLTDRLSADNQAAGEDELTKLKREYADVLALEGTSKGEILAIARILRAKPEATDAEINDWQMGNLCRCTGYYGIARAIAKARDAR